MIDIFISTCLDIQKHFQSRLILVGSVLDCLYFNHNTVRDLDFVCSATDYTLVTEIAAKLGWKEYSGLMCGKKLFGRWGDYLVDIFVTYPSTPSIVYCGITCGLPEDRYRVLLYLSQNSQQKKWSVGKRLRSRALLDRGITL